MLASPRACNLPDHIWGWWWAGPVVDFLADRIAPGWFAEKFRLRSDPGRYASAVPGRTASPEIEIRTQH